MQYVLLVAWIFTVGNVPDIKIVQMFPDEELCVIALEVISTTSSSRGEAGGGYCYVIPPPESDET